MARPRKQDNVLGLDDAVDVLQNKLNEPKVGITPAKGIKQEEVTTGEYTANIVKDYDGQIDPFYLSKKDPDFEYRFLRDEAKNMNMKRSNLLFQKGGWQVCPKEHLKRIGLKDEDLTPDGLCRRGDTILAFMPKSLYEEKMAYKSKLANEPIDAIQRMIKNGDPDSPTLSRIGHSNMKGLQTQKDLGM